MYYLVLSSENFNKSIQLCNEKQSQDTDSSTVIKSKLILLTTQQANKLGDGVLGQEIVTVFGRKAD